MTVSRLPKAGEVYFPASITRGDKVEITFLFPMKNFPHKAFLEICKIIEQTRRLQVEFDCKYAGNEVCLFILHVKLLWTKNIEEVIQTVAMFCKLFKEFRVKVLTHSPEDSVATATEVGRRIACITETARRLPQPNKVRAWTIATVAFVSHREPKQVAHYEVHATGHDNDRAYKNYLFQRVVPLAEEMIRRWQELAKTSTHEHQFELV